MSVELAWDESLYNRWPTGSPYGLGGQFKPSGVSNINQYRAWLKKNGEDLPEGMPASGDATRPTDGGNASGGSGSRDDSGSGDGSASASKPYGSAERLRDVKADAGGYLEAEIKKDESLRPHEKQLNEALWKLKNGATNFDGVVSGIPLQLRGEAKMALAKALEGRGFGIAYTEYEDGSKSPTGITKRPESGEYTIAQIQGMGDEERYKIPMSDLPPPPKGKRWAEDRSLVSTRFYDNADLAETYTKPKLRARILARVKAEPGPWSAAKAARVAKLYEAAGGGYVGGRKRPQRALKGSLRALEASEVAKRLDWLEMASPATHAKLKRMGALLAFSEEPVELFGVADLAVAEKEEAPTGSTLMRILRANKKVRNPEALGGWIASRKRGGTGRSSGGSSGGSSGKSRKVGAGGLADRVRAGEAPEKKERRSVIAKRPALDPDDDPFGEDYGPEEEKTPEQKAQERMEQALIRKMEKEDRARVYAIIVEQGGLKTRPELREEYAAVPNVYKRRDGMDGDELADVLARNYPELGIESENDLLDFLAA